MLSPRGQAGLEAKFLASVSASASKTCPRPRPRPRAIGLGLSSNFLFWPRENAFSCICWKTAGGVSKISTANQPGSQQGVRCCSWATYQEMRTGLFSHYRTATASQSPSATCLSTASQQLHRYLTVINSEAFDPSAKSSRLDRLALDFPLLQPLFSRMFCVPASSAPVGRIFSQSGIIMSARRAHMSNAVLGHWSFWSAIVTCRSW